MTLPTRAGYVAYLGMQAHHCCNIYLLHLNCPVLNTQGCPHRRSESSRGRMPKVMCPTKTRKCQYLQPCVDVCYICMQYREV